ncbi:D-hexose-6-phosphate mutarotase [Thalassotalea sp. Y01]|uniref:D-hexose-6-phosphate mutarotase n=1 Tax=Thalassotalea sp. Y01 TaxID=2729613 RepID=UPI00145FA945|nr:D-hexose-6-phosphate mutarotase [Thalassotalea sp. Y01]NMP14869.1 D-hexose-6-phosphate mutarotase [Thalassotalea sp. Y01]
MIAEKQSNPSIRELDSNNYGSINARVLSDSITLIDVSHDRFEASLSLHGGQILSWQPNGQKEVFWLSKKAKYDQEEAIRGGVPLCWPWFGALEGGGNHGFARTSQWSLAEYQINQDDVVLTLVLEGEQSQNIWPFKYQLTQRIVISNSLQQTLNVTNTSDKAFRFNGALHSYFRVSDPKYVAVPVLNNHYYDDKISSHLKCTPSDVFNCVGPIDRIYHCNSSATIFDKHWKRAIEIKKSNCPQWVLWNPGKATASAMADVHQGGENEFVCLEASNTNWLTVEAGKSIELSQEIQVYNV